MGMLIESSSPAISRSSDSTASAADLPELSGGRFTNVELAPLATKGDATIAQKAKVFGVIDSVRYRHYIWVHVASFGSRFSDFTGVGNRLSILAGPFQNRVLSVLTSRFLARRLLIEMSSC